MMKSDQSIAYVYFWGDLITLFVTFFVSVYFFSEAQFVYTEWWFLIGVSVLWAVIGYSRMLYFLRQNNGFLSRFLSFTKTYLIWVIFVNLIYFMFGLPLNFKEIMIAFFLGFLIMGLTANIFINVAISFLRRKRNNVVYTVVAGVGNLAGDVEKHISNHYNKQRQIRGFIKSKKEVAVVNEEKVIGKVKDMDRYLHDHRVDEIVIALPLKPSKKVQKIMNIADYHGVRVKYVIDYKGAFGRSCKTTKYGQIEALNIRQLPLDEKYASLIKDYFDLLFSFFALLFLFPVFIIIGIVIKLDSPGPVFYCPTRIGKGGKPIKIYKFRTMVENDAVGLLSTSKNDPRITKLGKILRKYSIDELPQFINVLLGEMSVVGPRPHRIVLNKQFQESEANYMIRHYYRPGITGWAQVNGWRGPTETKEQKQKRTEFDLWYLENWTFWLDLKIIWMTIAGGKTRVNAF